MTVAALPLPAEPFDEVPAALPPEAPEPNPVAIVLRAMRGRWKTAIGGGLALGGLFGAIGYLSGAELYESQAILRVFPQESNILYATGDDSVLKTFDSFVRAETSFVASHMVMGRAADMLAADWPDLTDGMTVTHLTRSVDIRRSESLIVLTTLSRNPGFATEKLDAVVAAYMALTAENEEARTQVRLAELHEREAELVARLDDLRAQQLEIGGEFGVGAISAAHNEKITQIDDLALRLSEVTASIAALEAGEVSSSVDGADQEIMRATLLDDTIGALGAQRARLLIELAGLRADYADRTNPRFEQSERSLLNEIAVVEEALSNRREQIRVLAQTGALTDTPAQDAEQSMAELVSLRDRIAVQLETARQEARDLNRRRVELDRTEQEIEEQEALLVETLRALEVIRLESGRALLGYTVLMSPPSEPIDPADDTRKMNAAMGVAGGAGLALFLALALGLSDRRLRHAETLAPVEHRLPVLQVSGAGDDDPAAADRLRNELQLHPLRRPRLVGKAPVVTLVRAVPGSTADIAQALAESYARARMRTLLIEADLSQAGDELAETGWADLLSGRSVDLGEQDAGPGLWVLPAGSAAAVDDRAVSAPMVRTALDRLVPSFDVIIVSGGSLSESFSAKFLLQASDVGVLAMTPGDRRAEVLRHVDGLDTLPRNGSVAVLRRALPGDPWRAIRT